MSTTTFPKRGLYAVTDTRLCRAVGVVKAVSEAVAGGAAVVQYRDKSEDGARRADEAATLLSTCRQASVPLIVNDDIELALAIGADGVHVGKDDQSLELARAKLGPDAIVGVSCYDSLDRALRAQAAGATYVAFGSFFPSSTKPCAPPVNIAAVRTYRTRITVPIVAIGGITAQNGAALLAAGVDLLAVVSDVFANDDPRMAAGRIANLFEATAS